MPDTTIVDGVVQVELVQPVEPLALLELVEIQRQRGPVVELAKAARPAFEMQADFRVNHAALLHRRPDILADLLLQGRLVRRRDFNNQARNPAIGEELLAYIKR